LGKEWSDESASNATRIEDRRFGRVRRLIAAYVLIKKKRGCVQMYEDTSGSSNMDLDQRCAHPSKKGNSGLKGIFSLTISDFGGVGEERPSVGICKVHAVLASRKIREGRSYPKKESFSPMDTDHLYNTCLWRTKSSTGGTTPSLKNKGIPSKKEKTGCQKEGHRPFTTEKAA